MQKIVSHTPKSIVSKMTLPGEFRLTLTCQSGLESLVRKESEKIGLTDTTGQDRLISGTGNLETLYKLLIGSRFANRVYIELAQSKITDFDELFSLCSTIDWGIYLTGKERIIVEASSTRSVLSSIPTLQSISQKSIFDTLRTPNTTSGVEVHILILVIDDIARVLIDVTGDPLHKRGYREEAGEAPIKENLAAALIAFVSWRYKSPLFDPFCGSGTLAIEAAMIARNIAPGVNRHFRIESLPFHNASELTSVRNIARMKAYPSGEYKIYASDLDEEMIEIAKRNALRAGVRDDIVFEVADFQFSQQKEAIIVTNPPYGNRLKNENLDELYTKLIHTVQENNGGFITSYPVDVRHGLANKKLLNGNDECRFWYKPSPR